MSLTQGSRPIHFSKTAYLAAGQCSLKAWKIVHAPGERNPVALAHKWFWDGEMVDRLAPLLFDRPTVIHRVRHRFSEALNLTQKALEQGVTIICQAAIVQEEIGIVADVLERNQDGTYNLYEVKSSTWVKNLHLNDLSLQAYLLRKKGLSIRRILVLYINKNYVYDGVALEPHKLFVRQDVTTLVEDLESQVPELVDARRLIVVSDTPPAIGMGTQCIGPDERRCDYFSSCRKSAPRFPVWELPAIAEKTLVDLREQGIAEVWDIPRSYPGLSPTHRWLLEVLWDNKPFVHQGLLYQLQRLRFPLAYLEVTGDYSAIPIYPGTRPSQRVPVRWSLTALNENGVVTHLDEKFDGIGNPMQWFARRLPAMLDQNRSILSYCASTGNRLGEMAQAFPEHSRLIQDLQYRIWCRFPFGEINLYGIRNDESQLMRRFIELAQQGLFRFLQIDPAFDHPLQEAFYRLMDPNTSEDHQEDLNQELRFYCRGNIFKRGMVFKGLLLLGYWLNPDKADHDFLPQW